MRRSAWVLLTVLSIALPSGAAPDDDLLAPLTPPPTKSTPKRRPPPTAKRPKKPAKSPSDRPTLEKSELLVTLRAPLDGAHLFVDDRDLGRLPLAAREVSAGFHTVSVRKSGFADYVQQVDLKSGQRIELSVQLEMLSAVLKVHGSPAGAVVSVDGARAGSLPLGNVQVTPGAHTLTVQAEGFAPFSQAFTVKAGRDERVQVDLNRLDASLPPEATPLAPGTAVPPTEISRNDSGFFSHWYVWVGIGVVAGGLAAGGWAIGSHAHPTPPSSTVCSGPCDAVLKTHAPGF